MRLLRHKQLRELIRRRDHVAGTFLVAIAGGELATPGEFGGAALAGAAVLIVVRTIFERNSHDGHFVPASLDRQSKSFRSGS